MIGLPPTVAACLFDLDGVLTDTASLHAEAWKRTFDAFLRARDGLFEPFDLHRDYADYVDGKQRNDGVRAFLASRRIEANAATVHALADRKNSLVLRLLDARGVRAFPDAVCFLRAVREAGIATAVVSASANCAAVLEAASISSLFDVRVDANAAAQRGLRGKPAPDMFLAAARLLGCAPAAAAVFEDALAGVEAGRAGGFRPVVGVARRLPAARLREHGADVVVRELTELLRYRVVAAATNSAIADENARLLSSHA